MNGKHSPAVRSKDILAAFHRQMLAAFSGADRRELARTIGVCEATVSRSLHPATVGKLTLGRLFDLLDAAEISQEAPSRWLTRAIEDAQLNRKELP